MRADDGLTLGPDGLAFEVAQWREIVAAAHFHLYDGQPFTLSTPAVDELYDVGTELLNDYDRTEEGGQQ